MKHLVTLITKNAEDIEPAINDFLRMNCATLIKLSVEPHNNCWVISLVYKMGGYRNQNRYVH